MLKNLYLLGDIGFYNNNLKMCVNNIKNGLNSHDAIVLLGDNFYPNGLYTKNDIKISNFNEIFKNVKQPIYSILGNHDYLLYPQAQINHTNWIMDDFYFKKSYSNIDLYFIDTTQFFISDLVSKKQIENVHNKSIENLIYNQLYWLESELKKNIHKPKIIIGHYPILTNGFYFGKMDNLYDLLIHLFKRYKIKAYISGHEHNVQFINQQFNNYIFKQIIIGSSSENRTDPITNHIPNNICSKNMDINMDINMNMNMNMNMDINMNMNMDINMDINMYDNSDIFYGKLSISNSNIIKFEYINKYKKSKYEYIL
jgi:predicted MPP superfamily phosphohydrolase